VDALTWTPVLVLLGALLIAGWIRADRSDGAAGRHPGVGGEQPAPPPTRGLISPADVIGPADDVEDLLVGPPVVEMPCQPGAAPTTVPLRDWLVHLHPENSNVWSDVVTEFYATIMAEPAIADYFHDADLAALQNHFMAVVIAVTGEGVTATTVQQLRTRHAGMRDSNGNPISGAIFDRAAGVLTDILRAKAVPDRTLRQVDVVLALFRQAITAPGR